MNIPSLAPRSLREHTLDAAALGEKVLDARPEIVLSLPPKEDGKGIHFYDFLSISAVP
jgi:hypothetical protein